MFSSGIFFSLCVDSCKIVQSISLLKIKDSELNRHIINVLICNMQLFSQVNLQDFIVLARFAHKENSLLFKDLMRLEV